MNNHFRELLQISVGTRQRLSRMQDAREWMGSYSLAEKHAVVGVLLEGLERMPSEQRPPQEILLQWIGMVQIMEQAYNLHCEHVRELSDRFLNAGYRSCILKGIGIAQYYPNPQRRQGGDIDIWVDGERNDVIVFLKNNGEIGHIDIKHCDWKVFGDTEVEVHFISTWFYNPFVNRRLQRWLNRQKAAQFENRQNWESAYLRLNLI